MSVRRSLRRQAAKSWHRQGIRTRFVQSVFPIAAMLKICCVIFVLGCLAWYAAADISIDLFGALHNDPSDEASLINAAAFTKAFLYANSSSDRTVLVPALAAYSVFPISVSGLYNVTLDVRGTVIANTNTTAWPIASGKYADIFYFENCHNIHITGSQTGLIDGKGYQWWLLTILNLIHHDRPHMVHMEQCTNILINDLSVKNSPMFHFLLHDVADVVIFGLDIYVNTTEQRSLITEHGRWTEGIPLFPLNTDGIDPAGVNIHIYNISVENFDDVVAVKPMNGNGRFSSCRYLLFISNLLFLFAVLFCEVLVRLVYHEYVVFSV